MISRARLQRFVLPLAALALFACGKAVPRYQLRTAPEWVTLLWDPDARVRSAASDALGKLAETAPEAVLSALEAAITSEPPAPSASPFSVAVDSDGGRRLGLAPSPVTEAVAGATEVIRARTAALNLTPASIKGLYDGTIDIVLMRPLPRAGVERVQRLFCTRGAVELRLVVPDPLAPAEPAPVPGAARRVVYEGAKPYADYLAGEARAYAAAWSEKRPYIPSDPRFRAVPRTKTPTAPADFVLVEEPRSEAEALDERMVHASSASTVAGGRSVVTIKVREERQAALARFSTANLGLSMAVVLDGFLFAVVSVPVTSGATLDLDLWKGAGAGQEPDAEGMAALLVGGRMPWPLKPIPLEAAYGTDPPPDNLLSRAFALLEGKAIPTLERLAATAPLSWTRASAKWALDQIKARAEAPGH